MERYPDVVPLTSPEGVVGDSNDALGAAVVTGVSVDTTGVCGISGLQPRMLNRKAGESPCQATG